MENDFIEKPDEQLGFLLMQASLLKQRINNAALKELDVTYMQFAIMAGVLELGSGNNIVTQQTLVVERRLDKAMVSTILKTLIAKKLMVRTNHPSDNRAMMLTLTEEGKRIALRGKEIAKEIDVTFFDGIDKEMLRMALKKTLTNSK